MRVLRLLELPLWLLLLPLWVVMHVAMASRDSCHAWPTRRPYFYFGAVVIVVGLSAFVHLDVLRSVGPYGHMTIALVFGAVALYVLHLGRRFDWWCPLSTPARAITWMVRHRRVISVKRWQTELEFQKELESL